MTKVKQLTPNEIIYTAPDDMNKKQELGPTLMPVTKGILEKYGPDGLENIREGMIGRERVKIAEIHVKNSEAGFIEAETGCENPVFYFGMANCYVMAVTNFKNTGSNIVVKAEDLNRAQRRRIAAEEKKKKKGQKNE